MSRLPKPTNSTKIRPIPLVKPFGSTSENTITFGEIKTRAHEAPPAINKYPTFTTNSLRRRSKSVADLTTADKHPSINKCAPLIANRFNKNRRQSKSHTDLTTIDRQPFTRSLKPITERKAPTAGPQNKAFPSTSRVPPLKSGATKTTLVGSKRPAAKSDEGGPKAKAARKLPDWDYKGRFLQLNEKYEQLQSCMKGLQDKANQFESTEKEYEKIQKEHEIAIKNIDSLRRENESKTRKCQELTISLDELKPAHETLTRNYSSLQNNFDKLNEEYNKYQEQNKNLLEKLNKEKKENIELKEVITLQKSDLINYQTERRVLHNTIQDLKGNIRVFCRIRPLLPSELKQIQCSIEFINENGIEIRKNQESYDQITGKLKETKSEFTYDKVFAPQSSQEEVFEDLAQLVQSALDGYNVCVFAYGQTGSGKTYTMQGGGGIQKGMIPRTFDLIFKNIAELQRSGWSYTVKASFLEIYNENIRDLLNTKQGQKHDICFNEGAETTVTNLSIQTINSAAELERYMVLAHRNRATAATDFNEHSSRSHAVTKIHLEGTLEDLVYKGSLNLVDLAGSENAKQSVAGERLTETKNINKSLATLGDVIQHLHHKSRHIPYRNSKLTYLLQSSLGGNSKTLMIVNISPIESCFMESINSLRFAAKVKQVKIGSRRNKMNVSSMKQ
ncbi:unnamed protein product [Ceutorhynchus assimilis]|uniref:Kinesin-like protein n=1 Tax=Ceutorhynchus assimilis TaxID=467358 RepID=A0A9N9MQY9_9CUCU|nr:unnamed protein product [Ceutorhynchus assimilis]